MAAASENMENCPAIEQRGDVTNTSRHPKCATTKAPSGMPATEAADQPIKINAIVAVRFSAGMMRPTVTEAWGEK